MLEFHLVSPMNYGLTTDVNAKLSSRSSNMISLLNCNGVFGSYVVLGWSSLF